MINNELTQLFCVIQDQITDLEEIVTKPMLVHSIAAETRIVIQFLGTLQNEENVVKTLAKRQGTNLGMGHH